jgi:hypothetical protein
MPMTVSTAIASVIVAGEESRVVFVLAIPTISEAGIGQVPGRSWWWQFGV